MFLHRLRAAHDYVHQGQGMEAMKGHSRLLTLRWMLALGAVVLIAGHAVIFYYILRHRTLSAALVSGAIILVVINHVGLLGPLYALFRRRSRR